VSLIRHAAPLQEIGSRERLAAGCTQRDTAATNANTITVQRIYRFPEPLQDGGEAKRP
jgi:hypothetical protein